MKRFAMLLSVVLVVAFVVSYGPVTPASAQAKKIVMYMQMGGDAGAPSVLARTNGAKAAAAALGI